MKHLAIFLLLAGFALPEPAAAENEARAAARERMSAARAARSRPAMQSARRAPMPMQRSMSGMPQQHRSFRSPGAYRSERMMEGQFGGQMSRSRVYNAPRVGPRLNREMQPRQNAINTAVVADQPVRQAPTVDRLPRVRDGNRADRFGAFANGNREWPGSNVAPTTSPSGNLDGVTGTTTTNTDSHEGHRHGNRGRNWRERHRDWHERHAGDPNFDEKHRRYHRRHYNRDWWRRNYNRFVLFGGGYYYWNSGYWYPAYGYDPSYSSYTYDAPLYSYNGLPPGQVISIVQSQLQQRGYYRGAVDGSFGPRTRQALLNFQGDAGLPMTGEIDQETLNALGYD